MKPSILKICLGIDVSKDELAVCLSQLDSTQHISIKGTRKFANTTAGLQALRAWVGARRNDATLPFCVLLEATGVYYEAAAYYWREQGVTVHVVLPNQAKNFARSLNVKSKTDALDARMLAQMGLERKLKAWQGLSEQMLLIKQLCRERTSLLQHRTRLLNQQHALCHSHRVDKATLRRLAQHLLLINKQVKAVEQQLQGVLQADKALHQRVLNLCQIKGVAVLSVLTILAETNGFELFANKNQVVSYAGLDVRQNLSGTSIHGKPHISKRGNAQVRRALFMPALATLRFEPLFKAFYERIVARNPKTKMIGVVAVQRKLLVLLYSLYKKNEPFDPNYTPPQRPSAQKQSRQDKVLPTQHRALAGTCFEV